MAAAASSVRQPAQSHAEETKSKASRARDSDGLDSVSQVSVSTPKSRAGPASRAGDSVSYVTDKTQTTTVSTKRKLQDLEREL